MRRKESSLTLRALVEFAELEVIKNDWYTEYVIWNLLRNKLPLK